MGTPQDRWRDTTQAGRFSIMDWMRLRPEFGTQRTCSMEAKALARRSLVSMEMNHWGVLRNINGALDRQECGYEWVIFPRPSNAPAAIIASHTGSSALYTCVPANIGT